MNEVTTAAITADVMSSRYTHVDPDQFILAGVDCNPTVKADGRFDNDKPTFSVGEFAQFFFAKSSYWVRWLDKKAVIEADCEKCEGSGRTKSRHKCNVCNGTGTIETVWQGWREAKRTESGARYYTLDDVEAIAHSIAQRTIISPAELRLTLVLVKVQAQMYRLIV